MALRRTFLWGGVALLPFTAACELEETALTEPREVLVAEVYVKVGDGSDEMTAFLQWTLGGARAPSLEGTTVRLEGAGGRVIPLLATDLLTCLSPDLEGAVDGVCFQASPLEDDLVAPGDRMEVEIAVPGGGSLQGGVLLPGDFTLVAPGVEACALSPGTGLELLWTGSEGAWAYTGEAVISGLRDALAPSGIELEEDSVTLVGLSVSEADTTLVFPQEFGVFDRFDLDRDLALALQEGLPEGAEALVVLSALERNYVNWVRGGGFNPSGLVRVPSLQGDGVGVLGGVHRRLVRVVGGSPTPDLPSCAAGG